MKTSSNDEIENARWLAEAFRSVDWLIPAYLSIGLLRGLATVIYQAEDKDKVKVFTSILRLVYTPKHIAAMYMYRYSVTDQFSTFTVHIDEAIRAYYTGFRHVAISSMIPVLEGIVRNLSIVNDRDVGRGTSGLIKEFDALVEWQTCSPNRSEEQLIILETLRDFMRDKFLKNTNGFDGLNQFNRHGILHGVFDDYGYEVNFFRIITILDLLCFMINMRFPRTSFFAPESTEASDALAVTYLTHSRSDICENLEPSVKVIRAFLTAVGQR